MGRASKDKRDVYYRKAKEEGYRARSAYKLLQLHEEYGILNRKNISTGVVDLCAAPGSWSQVLATLLRGDEKMNEQTVCGGAEAEVGSARRAPRIVAVDLQEMMPIDGVMMLQGDITSEATAREIVRLLNASDPEATCAELPKEGGAAHNATCGTSFNGDNESECGERKADLVLCDGAPDVTGMHELDEYLQHHLLLAALNITTFVLRPGGTFVTKIFRGPNTPFLVSKSEIFFQYVMIVKPKSSRNASMEAFMLCQNYRPRADYVPSFDRPLTLTGHSFTPGAPLPPSISNTQWKSKCEDKNVEEVLVPFLACGDLSGYDADMCYDREGDFPMLPPLQMPL